MLVRRLTEAPEREWHQLTTRILMDAGELGSRHMTITRVELEPGVEQELHTHEEAEQAYVVMSGSGTVSVAGDSQRLEPGDLVLVPPASDHGLANPGEERFELLSIQSPAVSVDEVFGRQRELEAEYDEEDF